MWRGKKVVAVPSYLWLNSNNRIYIWEVHSSMANTTADIGFEKQIWDAACVLRGNMDASEYKNIVLGLID